nr:Chain P, Peptide (PT9) of HIV gp120 MN isolate (IGPGRAFYT) [HIV-1 M:B_MN]5T7G_Q Chain Q, Peptide (PT9) of HIV gp120 MN isolate (IGPGRAFYT) [HIV-1 M:B_MN]
IGPGRAFYT